MDWFTLDGIGHCCRSGSHHHDHGRLDRWPKAAVRPMRFRRASGDQERGVFSPQSRTCSSSTALYKSGYSQATATTLRGVYSRFDDGFERLPKLFAARSYVHAALLSGDTYSAETPRHSGGG